MKNARLTTILRNFNKKNVWKLGNSPNELLIFFDIYYVADSDGFDIFGLYQEQKKSETFSQKILVLKVFQIISVNN